MKLVKVSTKQKWKYEYSCKEERDWHIEKMLLAQFKLEGINDKGGITATFSQTIEENNFEGSELNGTTIS